MNKEEKLKKLKRNFVLHMICNISVGVIILVNYLLHGVTFTVAFCLMMLGVCVIATGATCDRIAKVMGTNETIKP